MTKVKKFLHGSDHAPVKNTDVVTPNSWVLKWDPASKDSGFELFTPGSFDPEENSGPLGGLILAAVYFLIEHGELDFPKELISRANALSKEIESQKGLDLTRIASSHRTLN